MKITKSMNILHLTHTDINFDSRILKEMQSIAKSNNTFTVSGIGVIRNEAVEYKNNVDNISIYSIVLRTRKWKFLPEIARHICSFFELSIKVTLKSHKLRPDVIHCNDNLLLPIAVIIKLITSAKLIYDAHELESNKNGITEVFGKFILYTEKKAWNFIDALIVVSPSIEKWYYKNIGKKDSEVVLNSPIFEKGANVNDSTYLRDHFSIEEDSRIFLYIGILVTGRGIDLVTDAFKQHDLKSSLVFLGQGELSDELKVLSQKHANIYVHDAVPHRQVVAVAKSADVGLCLIQNVSLSDYYCLPNKLFEYCFAGVPVLASEFPDISQVVTKYNLGKCCKLDSDSVYKAIQELENMNELPKVNIENLYDLSWGAQEDKLIKLYKKLIQ